MGPISESYDLLVVQVVGHRAPPTQCVVVNHTGSCNPTTDMVLLHASDHDHVRPSVWRHAKSVIPSRGAVRQVVVDRAVSAPFSSLAGVTRFVYTPQPDHLSSLLASPTCFSHDIVPSL